MATVNTHWKTLLHILLFPEALYKGFLSRVPIQDMAEITNKFEKLTTLSYVHAHSRCHEGTAPSRQLAF